MGIITLSVTAQTDAEKEELADNLLKIMSRNSFTVVPSERDSASNPRDVIIKGHPFYIESRATAALLYAKANGIPLEAVLEAAKAQVKSYAVLEANGNPGIAHSEKSRSMLRLLGVAGDPSALPFLEEMSFALSNRWVCMDASDAYVSLATTNSVPFIRKVMADRRPAGTGLSFTGTLNHFIQVLKNTPDINDESLAFLCEFVEVDGYAPNVRKVDEFLCAKLLGYSNSVQRLTAMRRHLEYDSTWVREYFTSAKEAIEKIPENERKDFRTKGGLLDPDRKKEP